MRTTLLLPSAFVLSLAACGGGGNDGPTTPTTPTNPAPSAATVEAGGSSNTFTPAQVTVARGGTVTWTFGARVHNVTFAAATGAPQNVPNSSNVQVARTFPTAGSFPYDCTLHNGMTGSVVVQ